MADYVTLLEVRYKAVCQELHDVTAKRNELALKLDEYEHRAKLHMDRCRHDMERIVRLEQQNEALASRLETYQTALAQIAAFIEQQRQSVENREVETPVNQRGE